MRMWGMSIIFASESKRAWRELLTLLKGAARRIFMASIVKSVGRGGFGGTRIGVESRDD